MLITGAKKHGPNTSSHHRVGVLDAWAIQKQGIFSLLLAGMLVMGKKGGEMKIRDSLGVDIPGGGRLAVEDARLWGDRWDLPCVH